MQPVSRRKAISITCRSGVQPSRRRRTGTGVKESSESGRRRTARVEHKQNKKASRQPLGGGRGLP